MFPDEWREARTDTVVEALGVASAEELTGPDFVRILVQVFTSTGEVLLVPQVIGDDGWWETPAHPDSRSMGLHDALPLWGRVIVQMVDGFIRDRGR